MASCEQVSAENIDKFLASVDTVLTDCDGVLWNGPDLIPGADEALTLLRKKGKKVYFVTNNSSKSRSDYVKKCSGLGIQATEDEIIGTAYVAAQYIKHTLKYDGKVYMVGGNGIAQELDLVGLTHNPPGEDPTVGDVKDWAGLQLDPEVRCVLVGFDTQISYMKFMKAVRYLREVPGCHFVATNTDSVLPMGGGTLIPGTGCIVNFVQFGAGREPDVICGKPNKPIFEVVQQLHNIDPARTVMIGDRLNTDIMLGHNCGLQTLLVLTGFSSLADVEHNKASNSIEHQKQIPHYYIQSMGELAKLMQTTS